MLEVFREFGIWSAIDVLMMAYIIYYVLILIRGTRAAQMATGIVIIVGAYLLSSIIPLTTIHYFMSKFFSSLLVVLVILFQDDIRTVLSRIGKKSWITTDEGLSSSQIIDEIARAAASLAAKRKGALIVLERNIILTRYVSAGVSLDARVSKELLVSIFHPSSPIHDGAVVIQGGRVASAGCFLPLTRQDNLDPDMGTRHRAALGISQDTDAVVVLVSEEEGAISVVVDGGIEGRLDARTVRNRLGELLGGERSRSTRFAPIGRMRQRLARTNERPALTPTQAQTANSKDATHA